MVRRTTRKSSYSTMHINDPGSLGLDMITRAYDENKLAAAVGVRMEGQHLHRRIGGKQIHRALDDTLTDGSWRFTADADYALIPYASQLRIGFGGFGRRLSFKVLGLPPSGAGVVLASRRVGVTHGPHTVYITPGGNLMSEFRDATSTLVQNDCGGVLVNDEVNLLDVLDPIAGTFTSWINGTQAAQATGLADDVSPTSTSDPFTLGSEYEPFTATHVANTTFNGSIDAFTLFAFAGIDLSAERANGRSMIDTLVRWSLQTWPNPQSAMVRAHYDLDENSSVSALVDASRYKNDAAFAGTPATAAAVAHPALCGHYVGSVQEANGERYNTVGIRGTVYRERVR